MQPQVLHARIRDWSQRHQGVFEVSLQPDAIVLTEVASGKSLRLHAEAVVDLVSQRNAHTRSEYLAVQRHDGPPLALADAGFVFALDTRSTGRLPDAPPVMSFREFRLVYAHLRLIAELAPARREALDLMNILIASLDGARAAGLPTAIEVGELEAVLRRLESGS